MEIYAYPTHFPRDVSPVRLLQGWRIKSNSFPHYTVLPGLQFTLAGIMGKPVSYYVVPAIRMLFIVINYL